MNIFNDIFDPKVPPDKNWDFGETVIHISSERAEREPLKHRSSVLPRNARSWDGVFWK